MMKMKVHKGIKSRFKLTCSGKLLFKKRGFSHLLNGKLTKKKRKSKKFNCINSNTIKKKYISLI
ncbi:50S ribosomal protein L35 [Candidatus Pinguicoccus supinus]|uniref:50S ribosomal protein L35 n=1 Tax=Candidatus Pinguicoccus supinus TaxID=2529394 RepID=A0A7T0BRR6_9BACT|nr:50S ribosomal protein L35 [Candidatus Pinguicoccus supinus]